MRGKPRDADALVVLGYRCEGGRMDPLLAERLDTALALWKRYRYRYMILSGGAVVSDLTEAGIMRDYLVSQGVDARRILLEEYSRNTVHNIVNCAILMKQHRLQSCLFVSNSFHLRRMRYISKRLHIPASFYASRSISAIGRQWKLTFLEIKAFRLTLPWLEKASNWEQKGWMGNTKSRSTAG
ncbi:YdcF family protein [Paenibacillus sp. J2TS4]|uniref:YdcF family protein n=1 Tax=Paenibacillus sp. J2TS4 TaxID=2807194 RepID=UPI001BCC9A58|nr:YdcF family protein [Paenibacillus sp. J2TS4]